MKYILALSIVMFVFLGTAVAQQVPCEQSLRTVTAYANTVTTEGAQLRMQVAEFSVLVADLRSELTEATATMARLQKELDIRMEAATETEDDGPD